MRLSPSRTHSDLLRPRVREPEAVVFQSAGFKATEAHLRTANQAKTGLALERIKVSGRCANAVQSNPDVIENIVSGYAWVSLDPFVPER